MGSSLDPGWCPCRPTGQSVTQTLQSIAGGLSAREAIDIANGGRCRIGECADCSWLPAPRVPWGSRSGAVARWRIAFSDWLTEHGASIGQVYAHSGLAA